MKTFKSLVALAVAGVAGAAGAVTIDNFGVPAPGTQNLSIEQSAGVGTTAFSQYNDSANGSTNIIGGYRDLFLRLDDGVSSDDGARARIAAGNGGLSFSQDSGIKAYGSVQWDGNDGSSALNTTGLGGVDLTACGLTCDRFVSFVNQVDLGFGYEIVVWDMDGSGAVLNALSQFTVLPVGSTITDPTTQVIGPVEVDYLFAWFNLANGQYTLDAFGGTPTPLDDLTFTMTRLGNGGAIDFTKIGALELRLNTGFGGTPAQTQRFDLDLRLGAISTTTVPEPSMLALLGIGLIGFAAARQHRKPRSV